MDLGEISVFMVQFYSVVKMGVTTSKFFTSPLEKEMAIYSSILAWETPWTVEPGGLQSMGSPRVGHD